MLVEGLIPLHGCWCARKARGRVRRKLSRAKLAGRRDANAPGATATWQGKDESVLCPRLWRPGQCCCCPTP
eukprot:7595849-Alexandrium_andersonii.AAC.1